MRRRRRGGCGGADFGGRRPLGAARQLHGSVGIGGIGSGGDGGIGSGGRIGGGEADRAREVAPGSTHARAAASGLLVEAGGALAVTHTFSRTMLSVVSVTKSCTVHVHVDPFATTLCVSRRLQGCSRSRTRSRSRASHTARRQLSEAAPPAPPPFATHASSVRDRSHPRM